MTAMLGYSGGVLLVTILLALAAGLIGALYAATRHDARRTAGEARRGR
jgi:hypothetical protein